MLKKIIKLFRRPALEVMKLYWRVFRPHTYGVKIILKNADRVLLVKHTYGYKFTFPGGGMKKNETKEEAAKREVFEEVGIKILHPRFVDTLISTRFYKTDTINIFIDEVDNLEFKIDDKEIEIAGWYKIGSFPELNLTAQDVWNSYLKLPQ